jgi:hypothetical protein
MGVQPAPSVCGVRLPERAGGFVLAVALLTGCGGDTKSESASPRADAGGGPPDAPAESGVGEAGGVGGTLEGRVPPCPMWEGLEICDSASQVKQSLDRASILLVIDRSASMLGTVPEQNRSKWELLREALVPVLDGCAEATALGLELFPSSATSEPIPLACSAPPSRCCEMPEGTQMNVAISPGLRSAPEINDALDAETPTGATPAARALARAYDYFVEAGDSLGVARYVLLGTDGGPNCNEALDCDSSAYFAHRDHPERGIVIARPTAS